MSILVVGIGLEPKGYTPPSQRILFEALAERGLRAKDVTTASPWEAAAAIKRLKPTVVLALGDAAAAATIPAWSGMDGASAQKMRGYIFEGVRGTKTIPSIDPALVNDVWVPWRFLLSCDIQRAKDESKSATLTRPVRNVHVVRDAADAARSADKLRASRRLAADIETVGTDTLTCVGFATSGSEAIVYPPQYFGHAFDVLRSATPKIFQNGQYDAHFLLTRCGVKVGALVDDTLIAWHSCYPELAGAKLDSAGKKKGSKRTHKSLAFFSSIYTNDAWWKGDFDEDGDNLYVYNGKDCCITFDVMEQIEKVIAKLGVEPIYRHEISMIEPCVMMQARGLTIDEPLRQERVTALTERIDSADQRLSELLLPLIEGTIDSLEPRIANLFRQRSVCTCCRNGAAKKVACWSCAGFNKSPSKKALGDHVLTMCQKCEGRGESKWLEFNARSVDQKKAVLYDILHLPKRFVDGKLSTDADSLKSLLAHVA